MSHEQKQSESVTEGGTEQPLTAAEAEITPAAAGAGSEQSGIQEQAAEGLEQEISVLRERLAESQDRVLRAQAEMENLRKRTVRDIENAHKYALDRFIKELVPVIDSMELGINASESTDQAAGIREGMELTLKMFLDSLEKFGVETIAPQGEKFNPEQHEAVTMQEVAGMESGTVVAVMQKGYALNGRLVRPAMVMVAK